MMPQPMRSLLLLGALAGCHGEGPDLECTAIRFYGRVTWDDGAPVEYAHVQTASPGSCFNTCGDCEGEAMASAQGFFTSRYVDLCVRGEPAGGVSAECPTRPQSYWVFCEPGRVACLEQMNMVTCVCARTRP